MSKRLWGFTALDCLERCEEEFIRRYVQHLASTYQDPSPLFGQAVHAGVAELFRGKSVEDAQVVAVAAWKAGFPAPVTTGGLLTAQPLRVLDENGEPFFPKKKHLNATYLRAIVAMYAVEANSLKHGETLLNEAYLADEEMGFHGVVDRAQHTPGGIVVRDLKTTGLYVSDKWIAQWEQNEQLAGYLDLAERHLGEPVEFAWVEVVHLDRRGYPKPEDFAAYGPFHYSMGLRAELRAKRLALIARANYLVEHPGEALKRTRSCFRYNELCPLFHRGCQSDPAERDARYELAIERGELERREWSPAKRDKKEGAA